VGEAFNSGRLAVIEAGTGTGKSLAYLVPAILWALNNEERVVISTNTINLQEQLIRKDIPFLQRSTKLEFRAVLVKGRGNYLCRRRAAMAHAEPGLFDAENAGELQAVLAWAETSADGSKEELNFLPREEVWEEVRCEIDQCSRVRCADYTRCFFHKARRQAAQADILVVNHALLLSDLALRHQTDNYSAAAVLPPFDRIILDEAHHLEDVATNYFASQVTVSPSPGCWGNCATRASRTGACFPAFFPPSPRNCPRPRTNSIGTCTDASRTSSPPGRPSSTGRSSIWRRSARTWPPPWAGRS
jgi:ATP-dependent DNA helicase DinG